MCNIEKLISPVLDVVLKIQSNIGSVNLKEIATIPFGIWKSSICVNTKISIYYTKSDCTYTLVKIPHQSVDNNPKISYDRIFLVRLNRDDIISIPLLLNLLFVFTGNF